MQPIITLYTTKWCGPCRRLKRALDEAHIRYGEVDVDEDPAAGDRVAAWTGGYRTVPTAELGSQMLVDPTVDELKAALASPISTIDKVEE